MVGLTQIYRCIYPTYITPVELSVGIYLYVSERKRDSLLRSKWACLHIYGGRYTYMEHIFRKRCSYRAIWSNVLPSPRLFVSRTYTRFRVYVHLVWYTMHPTPFSFLISFPLHRIQTGVSLKVWMSILLRHSISRRLRLSLYAKLLLYGTCVISGRLFFSASEDLINE